MIVYKFKGAVLQDPEGLVAIKNRIRENVPCIIVVSALKGVMPHVFTFRKFVERVSGRNGVAFDGIV